MIDRIFVDSNVWIYLFTSDDIAKNTVAKNFIANNSDSILFVSYQIINEVASVLKRKGFKESHIQFVIETILDICFVQNFSKEIILMASELREKHSISYWDSLVVSAANAAKCNVLVSEDMQHDQIINGTTIKNILKQ